MHVISCTIPTERSGAFRIKLSVYKIVSLVECREPVSPKFVFVLENVFGNNKIWFAYPFQSHDNLPWGMATNAEDPNDGGQRTCLQ